MSLVVQDLVKRYPGADLPAIADVSFTAPDRAITALLGPSGSGKTTVLRVISGLEIPDSGSVHLDDVDLTYLPPQKRNVGFVFQSYALFEHMSVRDNVAFGLDVRRVPVKERNERVDELLELVQLQDFGARHPSRLSGGQRQRVAFARALAIQPRLLLLDEPFSALDAEVRVELRDWLHALHERTHLTTVLITHDEQEANAVASHVVRMRAGTVVSEGAIERAA